MPPQYYPAKFIVELIFSTIIVFFCSLVYYKTKDIYSLTKHKGIKYFRTAFLFFGLAYISRFIFHLIQMSLVSFDILIPRSLHFPIVFGLTGYFSSISILYLFYSTFWRKIKSQYFFIFSNIFALAIVLISIFTRSPFIVALSQFPILAIIIIVNYRNKKSHTKFLYLLLSLFWIINLVSVSSKGLISFEVKIILQFFSVGIFLNLIYRVLKWAK